ncbi:MAG TPA: hypothetical protein VFC18_05230, partial [Burkholderiales bacterium]|nr:hypothetical protein [Burkholderiales bacterium]
MKRPAFQFYPGDWQRDSALRLCSIESRGLWIELMCLMHQGEPYGHLALNGAAMTPAQIASLIGGGATTRKVARWLQELEQASVLSRDAEGRAYSRRMVRDEASRNQRAEFGRLGAQHGAKGAGHGVKG